MESTQGHARHAIAVVLRFALVFALSGAVWGVYRRLPRQDAPAFEGESRPAATAVRVLLRRPAEIRPAAAADRKIPVQLYPVNVESARNEYQSERRPGVRFEEFMTRLMGDRRPVAGELNERGEAVLPVPPGRWWVHVTIDGPEEVTWRLPVNVSGREKTVELTAENAYTRAKRF